MSNIVINGTTYSGVETITVKDTDGSDVKYTKGERPAGTIEITKNGTHDVTDYASANVNVNVFSGEYSVNSVVNENGNQTLNIVKTGTDRLQWKCDNVESLYREFYKYTGEDLSVVDGLDLSQVESLEEFCYDASKIKNFPKLLNTKNVKIWSGAFRGCSSVTNTPSYDFSGATNLNQVFNGCRNTSGEIIINSPNCENIQSAFQSCGFEKITLSDTSKIKTLTSIFYSCSKLKSASHLDFSSATNSGGIYSGCSSIEEISVSNTQNSTTFNNFANNCSKCKTIGTLDLYSATSISSMISGCTILENLTLKNIKISLQIGSGTSWGKLLTNASLLNTAKELWDNTSDALGGTRKLTMSTASKTAIQSIYVKLVDVTDDMIAQDQYISNKKPCVECASTDEGAMTVEEYIISKNWQIA